METGQPGMRAHRHAVLHRQLHRLAHDVRVAAVESAGDIGRRDVRHDLFVGAQRPAPVALAHVAVDVDVHAHGRPLGRGEGSILRRERRSHHGRKGRGACKAVRGEGPGGHEGDGEAERRRVEEGDVGGEVARLRRRPPHRDRARGDRQPGQVRGLRPAQAVDGDGRHRQNERPARQGFRHRRQGRDARAAKEERGDGRLDRSNLYPQRCDLSPDGRWLCYFTLRGKAAWRAGTTYVAISRLPWLTALAAWGTCGTWTRGAHFIDERGVSKLGPPREGDVGPCLEKFGLVTTRAASFAVERRRGWTETVDTEPRKPGDTWDESRPVTMQKARPKTDGAVALAVHGWFAAFRSGVPGESLYAIVENGRERWLEGVQWADWTLRDVC